MRCFLVCISKLDYANVCVWPCAYVNVNFKILKGPSVDFTHQHQFTHNGEFSSACAHSSKTSPMPLEGALQSLKNSPDKVMIFGLKTK